MNPLGPDNNTSQQYDEHSLEGPVTTPVNNDADAQTTHTLPREQQDHPEETSKIRPFSPEGNIFRRFLSHLNIYLLIFILVLCLGCIAVIVALSSASKNNNNSPVVGQPLTESQLSQLSSTSTTIGNSSQVLNIAASTIFSGSVLDRQSLDVAGAFKVGGTINSGSITASGTSNFQTLSASNLAINGTGVINGALTLGQGLSVAGAGSFGGLLTANQINVQTLQLNGDLSLNHHLVFGGTTPVSSGGSALGSGGTATVSGSDSAGSINISTGTSPPSGCLISLTFNHAFPVVPYVVVSPVGSATAGLSYYVTRTTSSMSVCASNPASNQSYQFDYIVVD